MLIDEVRGRVSYIRTQRMTRKYAKLGGVKIGRKMDLKHKFIQIHIMEQMDSRLRHKQHRLEERLLRGDGESRNTKLYDKIVNLMMQRLELCERRIGFYSNRLDNPTMSSSLRSALELKQRLTESLALMGE